jgi:RimJ/RimL family protein N-acetyltransferase
MRKPIKIQGNRIYLRELDESDATEEYCSWLNDKTVNRYLKTKKIFVEELKNYIKVRKNNSHCLFCGIFVKDDGCHIGNIKLEPINTEENKATMGMLIGDKNYWGKGLATETLKTLVHWAFENLEINTIDLGVNRNNTGAMRVYEKVGFKIFDQSKTGLKMKIEKINALQPYKDK